MVHNFMKVIFIFSINIQIWANPMLSYLDDEEIGAGSTSIFGMIFNIIVWGGLLYYWIWGNKVKETTEDEESSPFLTLNEPIHQQKQFNDLMQKIYERDRELGICFERNVTFRSFEDNKLTWESHANEDDKKMLITHWGFINMFVKDIFGLETKIINISYKNC